MVKAIAFDLEAFVDCTTMVDVCAEEVVTSLTKAGLNITKEEGFAIFSKLCEDHNWDDPSILKDFLIKVENKVDEKKYGKALIAFRNVVTNMVVSYQGMKKILEKLRGEGIKFALFGKRNRVKLWMWLASMDLDKYIDCVLGEELSLKCLDDKFKIAEKDILVVSSSQDVIKECMRMGMTGCFARYADPSGDKGNADFEVKNVNELGE